MTTLSAPENSIDAPMFSTEHFPSSFYPRQASPGRLVLEGKAADLRENEDLRKAYLGR